MAGTGTGIPRHRLFFLGFKNKDPGEASPAGGAAGGKQQGGWLARWRGSGADGKGKQQGAGKAPSAQGLVGDGSTRAGSVAGSAAGLQGQASLPASTHASSGGYDEAAAPSPWLEEYYGSYGAAAQPTPNLPLREQFGPANPAAAVQAAAAAAAAAAPQPVPRKPTSLWLSVSAEPGSPHGSVGGGAEGEAAEGADVAAERTRVEGLWQQW